MDGDNTGDSGNVKGLENFLPGETDRGEVTNVRFLSITTCLELLPPLLLVSVMVAFKDDTKFCDGSVTGDSGNINVLEPVVFERGDEAVIRLSFSVLFSLLRDSGLALLDEFTLISPNGNGGISEDGVMATGDSQSGRRP